MLFKNLRVKAENYLDNDLYKFAFQLISGEEPNQRNWRRYEYYTDLGKMFGLLKNDRLIFIWQKAETDWRNERLRRSITSRVNGLCG